MRLRWRWIPTAIQTATFVTLQPPACTWYRCIHPTINIKSIYMHGNRPQLQYSSDAFALLNVLVVSFFVVKRDVCPFFGACTGSTTPAHQYPPINSPYEYSCTYQSIAPIGHETADRPDLGLLGWLWYLYHVSYTPRAFP